MAKSDVVPSSMGLRRHHTGQTLVLEFTDPDGRVWHAGATLTTLRPAGAGAESTERRQLEEGDGMRLSAFKVVVP